MCVVFRANCSTASASSAAQLAVWYAGVQVRPQAYAATGNKCSHIYTYDHVSWAETHQQSIGYSIHVSGHTLLGTV